MIANDSAWRAAVVSPHYRAAVIGADVLRENGNALEAMVAAAAGIAALYPHMNGLGGDGFWLVQEPDGETWAINAAGRAAQSVSPAWYHERGYDRVPERGGPAAATVAGTVAGWSAALEQSSRRWEGRIPLRRLLEPTIDLCREGVAVSESHAQVLATKGDELGAQPGFAETFMPRGTAPVTDDLFYQPALASLLDHLADVGLDDFYRGDAAATMARQLQAAGSPISQSDLMAAQAEWTEPLTLSTSRALIRNLPPPTQGLASLVTLGLYERFASAYPHAAESSGQIHALVEATKRAFRLRDQVIGDPNRAPDVRPWLTSEALDHLGESFDPNNAGAWSEVSPNGDTVWLGAVDAAGRRVSFIQSLFHEFGAGAVVPETGLCWHNRACSFDMDPNSINGVGPGRQPFHTLNPAMAQLPDGRTVVYGTMGGHGQPQTQAAILTRLVYNGRPPHEAVAAPRWLLGRAWGQPTDSLKVESDMPQEVIDGLIERGHPLEIVEARNNLMGHAGMLVLAPEQGGVMATSDPRSDGGVDGVA